jgi:hypothetical protein
MAGRITTESSLTRFTEPQPLDTNKPASLSSSSWYNRSFIPEMAFPRPWFSPEERWTPSMLSHNDEPHEVVRTHPFQQRKQGPNGNNSGGVKLPMCPVFVCGHLLDFRFTVSKLPMCSGLETYLGVGAMKTKVALSVASRIGLHA